MKIAVAGGTGVAGRWTVDALRTGGHEAIVIARSAGADLVTGEGLEAALAGVDADMIRLVVRARGDRRLVVSVRVPGAAGKALAAGGGLSGRPGLRGTQTFTDWVTEQRARGTL